VPEEADDACWVVLGACVVVVLGATHCEVVVVVEAAER